MRLVIGADALLGPLTGIGQYTHHLAKHLAGRPEIGDLKFLAHGRVLPLDALLAQPGAATPDEPGKTAPAGETLFSRVRSAAARNRLLVRIYQGVFPAIEKWALRSYGSGDVFHSPNYMLPPFGGGRVVSILDLSTFRYPQYHPRARVDFINAHVLNALDKADHILTISDYIKDEIIDRFGVPEEKISTTYLGVDDSFRPAGKAEFDARYAALGLPYKQYLLFVSTIEPRKNLDTLLDAYELYRASAGEAALPLIVAGLPGWKSETIHQRLENLQQQHAIRYLGYLEQGLMPGLLAGARALLYPSLYEGFGLPVIEAMKSGTAVMTSRDSAMSEVACGAAVLVSPNDREEIAAAVQELAENGQRLATLEQRGLAIAGRYTWEHCADETLAAYLRAVG